MAQKIVIIGGGFGGVYVARYLLRCVDSLTLINDDAYFTFTPLLHEAATGTLAETDVRFPLTSFLPKNRLQVISSLATQVDFKTQKISLANGQDISYDILIIASGARTNTGLVKGCEHALCLKTMADVVSIKDRIAEMIKTKKSPFRVNVIGAGFTGLELICELAQLGRLKMNCACELHLFDRGPLPLTSADPKISLYVAEHLKKLGILFHLTLLVNER
jgi:NADH dehydrogenase